MENIDALLTRLAAQPKTHAVIATYDTGRVYRFEAPSLKQAQNHSIEWTRKLNKPVIERATGNTVRVVSVKVVAL